MESNSEAFVILQTDQRLQSTLTAEREDDDVYAVYFL